MLLGSFYFIFKLTTIQNAAIERYPYFDVDKCEMLPGAENESEMQNYAILEHRNNLKVEEKG